MPDSPLNIRTEARENYLYVHLASARTTPSKMYDWLAELSIISAETRKRCILVDRDVPNMVMNEDLHAALHLIANSRDGLHLAVVNQHPEVGREMKAALLGLGGIPANMEFFDDVNEAARWLTQYHA